MPLKSGSSSKTVSSNIRELHSGKTFARTEAKFGKDKAQKQSVAIALSQARGRDTGGALGPARALESVSGVAAPFPQGGAGNGALGLAFGGVPASPKPKMTLGAILSPVPGRTDAHYTHVPSGSYVIPADIVSGRGQGNTIAGAKALEKLFKMGPHGVKPMPIKGGAGAPRRPQMRADGGGLENPDHEPVRVNLAGGEIVVPPENLMDAVHPDLKTAHEIMDKWVVNERKQLRKTLAKLPGPVQADE